MGEPQDATADVRTLDVGPLPRLKCCPASIVPHRVVGRRAQQASTQDEGGKEAMQRLRVRMALHVPRCPRYDIPTYRRMVRGICLARRANLGEDDHRARTRKP